MNGMTLVARKGEKLKGERRVHMLPPQSQTSVWRSRLLSEGFMMLPMMRSKPFLSHTSIQQPFSSLVRGLNVKEGSPVGI
jgi:hypothetical protein